MTKLNAPLALRDIGMSHGELDRAASLVMQSPYANPRSTTHESILRLLDDAFLGLRPSMEPFSERTTRAKA